MLVYSFSYFCKLAFVQNRFLSHFSPDPHFANTKYNELCGVGFSNFEFYMQSSLPHPYKVKASHMMIFHCLLFSVVSQGSRVLSTFRCCFQKKTKPNNLSSISVFFSQFCVLNMNDSKDINHCLRFLSESWEKLSKNMSRNLFDINV